jgi:hypothetical protein
MPFAPQMQYEGQQYTYTPAAPVYDPNVEQNGVGIGNGTQDWKSPDVRSQYTETTAVNDAPPSVPPAATRSELGS